MRFKDYIWERVRGGILFFWISLTAISLISYSFVVIFIKNRQLDSNVRVAAYTVREAISAGDWPLALGHLKAIERSGAVFGVELRNRVGGTNITGPFGEKPFGIGTWCTDAPVGNSLTLNGCMRVLGLTELYTAVLFLLLAGALCLSVFGLFRRKMLLFIDRISSELRSLRLPTAQMGENSEADIEEIASIRNYIVRLLGETEKASEAIAKNKLSAQVAHDIRSPLTALSMEAEDLKGIAESQRILIRSAVRRIQDIANNLLQQNGGLNSSAGALKLRTKFAGLSNELISSHIENIVSEKRLQFRSRLEIEIKSSLGADSYGLFVKMVPAEFKRVLSNLINNAVEAIEDQGVIEIGLGAADDKVTVFIHDNGKGIPPEAHSNLMTEGFTFEKVGGSGLGLFHAKTVIESWGGEISIQSRGNEGTTVKIILNKAAVPSWFVPALEIEHGSTVVVLDDDISIHQVWQKRFQQLNEQDEAFRLFHFSTAEQFSQWHTNSRPRNARVLNLVDYELLGESGNGLQLIDSLSIADESILVTSRYEEESVFDECARLSVRLIPKALAGLIPVYPTRPDPRDLDCILIDDDGIIRSTWGLIAKRRGKKIRVFQTPKRFFEQSESIPRSVPIYVDSHLGNGVRGEQVAKEIREQGFERIYLATGHNPSDFGEIPWITEIVGKRPPWPARQNV